MTPKSNPLRGAMNKKPRATRDANRLPDGSGFSVGSLPLPKDHWLTAEGYNVPPMPLRMGTDNPMRNRIAEDLRAAGRYAVRGATMNGKEMDFDPDALIQNLIVGFLGYWTPSGLSSDEWANPKTSASESAQAKPKPSQSHPQPRRPKK